jgi:hypothetical protein
MENKRTRDEIIAEIKELSKMLDTETAHIRADELLLEIIDDEDVKAAFDAVSKWYA